MGLKRYAAGVVKEGKRVRWPKRDVLLPAILVVVIIAVITALIIMAWDWAGNSLIQILTNAFKGFVK